MLLLLPHINTLLSALSDSGCVVVCVRESLSTMGLYVQRSVKCLLRSLKLRLLEQFDLPDVLALGCDRRITVSFSFLERVVSIFSKIDLASL